MLDRKGTMANVNRNYRHKIRIVDYRSVKNELLQQEQKLVDVETLYADIKPIRGRELTESQILVSEHVYRVTTYYRPTITPDMYILWGDRTLRIESILDVSGREMHMEIMAREVERPIGRDQV